MSNIRRNLLKTINIDLTWIPLGNIVASSSSYYKSQILFDVRTPIYAIGRTDLTKHDCLWCSNLTFALYPPLDNNDYVTLRECQGYAINKFFGGLTISSTVVVSRDDKFPNFKINNYHVNFSQVSGWDYVNNDHIYTIKEESLSSIFTYNYIKELNKNLYTYYFDSPYYLSTVLSGIDITRYYILVPSNYIRTTINLYTN